MSYRQLLNLNYGNTASGAAYASSTSLTDVTADPQFPLPANQFPVGGTCVLFAHGIISTTGTPTIKLGFYYGGIAGVALGVSPATATGNNAASWPWILRWQGSVRTIGGSGTIMGIGELLLGTSLSVFAASIPLVPTSGAANAVQTIDTTTTKPITVGAQWGTNNAANTLLLQGFTVEDLARV